MTCRDKDQAVDPPGDERRRQLHFAHGVLVEAAGQNRHAARSRDVLDGAVQGCGERVGNVFDEQADGASQPIAAAQTAGPEVGPIVQRSMARWTFFANSGDTPGSSLTTRDTVFRLTPARAATSRIVGRGCRFAARKTSLSSR